MKSPIRRILKATSTLHQSVHDGISALAHSHKALIEAEIRGSFADSIDIDEALRKGNDQANRWDYLLGHDASARVVALEPHSAYTSEVSTVISKKKAARKQLDAHLKAGGFITAWFWVASGRVDFVPHEKVVRRLDQEGITFVGALLRQKHLPKAVEKKRPRTRSGRPPRRQG